MLFSPDPEPARCHTAFLRIALPPYLKADPVSPCHCARPRWRAAAPAAAPCCPPPRPPASAVSATSGCRTSTSSSVRRHCAYVNLLHPVSEHATHKAQQSADLPQSMHLLRLLGCDMHLDCRAGRDEATNKPCGFVSPLTHMVATPCYRCAHLPVHKMHPTQLCPLHTVLSAHTNVQGKACCAVEHLPSRKGN